MVWHTDSKNLAKLNADATEETKSFKDLMRTYWQTYCEKSTIHGVRYLYDPSVRPVERLIWSAVVITCVVLTCLSYLVLSDRLGLNKLQTVVDNSQFPVFPIPFPAVGVCTTNRVNWNKFEAAKVEFLPKNADNSLVEVFTTFVERMDSMRRFGDFNSFAEMQDLNLESLDFVNITKLGIFLSFRCEDIFYNGTCLWRKLEFDCCQAFILEQTESGMCLVFNSELSYASKQLKLQANSSYYPRHNSKAGQGTGLKFLLHLDKKFKKPNSSLDESVTIMIKKFDEWTGSGYTISPNSVSYVIVRPEITDTDESTRKLTPEQRNCLFLDEQDNPSYKTIRNIQYRQLNCLNVCHEEHLIKYCNCSLALFFPRNRKVRACTAADFRCLVKNNDIFSYDKRKEEDDFYYSPKPGMICYCLVSCSSMEYFTSLTTLPLSHNLYPNNTDVQVFEVDVHYQAEVIVKYRTSLEFTIIDLIANFGGIFGLCLGASMVSAVELLYYMTVGFWLYLYDNNYFRVFREEVKKIWKTSVQHYRAEAEEDYPRQENHRRASFKHRHPQDKKNVW